MEWTIKIGEYTNKKFLRVKGVFFLFFLIKHYFTSHLTINFFIKISDFCVKLFDVSNFHRIHLLLSNFNIIIYL